MRILIVGGTNFIGPHLVDVLRRGDHTITLFNRGRTSPEMFDDLERLRGDRTAGDYASLQGRQFDAVLDTCAYIPRAVRELREVLGGDPHYVIVSTVSVYADFSTPGIDETRAVATLEDPDDEEVTNERYGALKAACEEEARRFGSWCIVRPGLIVGPRDPTDRFTYWIARILRGGTVLAPPIEEAMQFVDVRDLAAFLADAAVDGLEGVFDAVHPAGFATVGNVLDTARELLAPEVEFRHVSTQTALALGAQPWSDLPAWAPSTGETAGLGRVSGARAAAAGLQTRPIAETVADTAAWWESLDEGRRATPRAGLSVERERELLETLELRDGLGAFWDEKYEQVDLRFGEAPNVYLTEQVGLVAEGGTVLCVGDGEGRNGVWLAERGFEVTALEPSGIGRARIEALAAKRGVNVEVVAEAMPSEALVGRTFDAVVLVFVHMPEAMRKVVHAQVKRLLAPGGVVLLEAYTPAQLESAARGGPSDPGLMYSQEILKGDFEGLFMEHLEETTVELDEGVSHQGASHVVRMSAIRRD